MSHRKLILLVLFLGAANIFAQAEAEEAKKKELKIGFVDLHVCLGKYWKSYEAEKEILKKRTEMEEFLKPKLVELKTLEKELTDLESVIKSRMTNAVARSEKTAVYRKKLPKYQQYRQFLQKSQYTFDREYKDLQTRKLMALAGGKFERFADLVGDGDE